MRGCRGIVHGGGGVSRVFGRPRAGGQGLALLFEDVMVPAAGAVNPPGVASAGRI